VETNILTPEKQLALGFTATSNDNPFPQFASVTQLAPAVYNSWYNSGYLKAQRRWNNGFTFMSHFTWSKTMDDYSAFCCAQPDYYGRSGRGLSWIDRKYRFVFAGTYDVPAGTGKRYFNHGPLNYVLGGWRVSPALNWETGQPLTPFMANVPGAVRPNCVGDPNTGPKKLNNWFNVDAFEAPEPFTYGNCASGAIIGPGYFDLDTSIQKDFPIPIGAEGKRLTFRMDSFNVLNHPNFGNPSTTICPNNSCTTNIITSTPPAASLSGRTIQLGLEFSF